MFSPGIESHLNTTISSDKSSSLLNGVTVPSITLVTAINNDVHLVSSFIGDEFTC